MIPADVRPTAPTGRAKPVELGFITVIALATVAAFGLRIPLLRMRGFDSDEFQHLHGAYCLAHGLLPYRDYFDHRTPWLPALLGVMLSLYGEGIAAVFRARYLMLAFAGAMVILTFWLGTVLRGRLTRGVAALLLSYNTIFVWKSLEIRPDTAAGALCLFALGGVIKGIPECAPPVALRRRVRRWAAVMFTQKALFAAAGLGLAVIWAVLDRRTGIRIGSLIRAAGMLTAGGGAADRRDHPVLLGSRCSNRVHRLQLRAQRSLETGDSSHGVSHPLRERKLLCGHAWNGGVGPGVGWCAPTRGCS